jgi:hypothetical protein
MQIHDVARHYASGIMDVALCVRGVRLALHPDTGFVIATPGALQSYGVETLAAVGTVVLDEADTLLAPEFRQVVKVSTATNTARSDQIRSGQIRSDQIRSDQIRSGSEPSGHPIPSPSAADSPVPGAAGAVRIGCGDAVGCRNEEHACGGPRAVPASAIYPAQDQAPHSPDTQHKLWCVWPK